MNFKFLTVVAITSLLALPAKAADSGIAIGAWGNMSTFDTTGTETEGNASNFDTTTETNTGSASKDVDFGSFFLEGVAAGDMFGLTVGVEVIPGEAEIGTKTRTDTQSDSNESSDDSGTYTGKAEVSGHFTIYAEPTIYVGNLGLYAKGGWTRLKVTTLDDIQYGEDSSAYDDKSTTGTLWGAGLRYKWGPMVLKAEYVETDYEEMKFTSSTGNKNTIVATPEQSSTRVGIALQF